MSWLLTEPETVLLVADDGTATRLRDSLLGGTATDLVVATTGREAASLLPELDDVGCVVVTDTVDDTDLSETVERVADAAGRRQVLAWAGDGDEATAHAATMAGATTYLRAGDTDAELTRVVDRVIDTYRDRRDEAADSGILETYLETLEKPMFAKDTEARHVRVSYVPEGVDPEAAVGKTDYDLFGDETDDAREMIADDLSVIDSEEPIRDKMEKVEYPGHTLWLETTKLPWYGPDGDLAGLVGITFDATERMELRLERESYEKRMETFTSYLSHDLKTPLQIAKGHLQVARESGRADSFEKVDDALDRIDEMIDDLSSLALDDTAAGGDPGPDASVPVDNRLHITDVIEGIWEIVRRESATLKLELEPEARIWATENDVRPIFENLFKNAMDHGGDDVVVTVGPTDSGGFYVADDGPGIPEDDRDQVFERGYTTAASGSGTGLSIVAETANHLSWGYGVTESASGGARFEFHECGLVPRADIDAEPTETVPLEDAVDVGDPRTPGSTDFDDDENRISVHGAGLDLWGGTNEFQFAYTTVEQPVRIEGRILSLEDTSVDAKSALMVRQSLDPDASYGGVGLTPAGNLEVLWRTEAGSVGNAEKFEDQSGRFRSFRVDAVDDIVRLSVSDDGREWHTIGQRRVDLDSEVLVGLAVCSHMPDETATAVFEDVTVSRLD
jgi:signal transduction histidine kinase/FixJ family two-component response regulator